MSSCSLATVATSFIDEVWNDTNGVAKLHNWLSPGYRDHAYDDDDRGLAKAITELKSAFQDARFEVEDVLASGCHAALRLRLHGTHTGTFRNLDATGRRVDVKVFRWLRFHNHLVAEHWALLDTSSLLRQITS